MTVSNDGTISESSFGTTGASIRCDGVNSSVSNTATIAASQDEGTAIYAIAANCSVNMTVY